MHKEELIRKLQEIPGNPIVEMFPDRESTELFDVYYDSQDDIIMLNGREM